MSEEEKSAIKSVLLGKKYIADFAFDDDSCTIVLFKDVPIGCHSFSFKGIDEMNGVLNTLEMLIRNQKCICKYRHLLA